MSTAEPNGFEFTLQSPWSQPACAHARRYEAGDEVPVPVKDEVVPLVAAAPAVAEGAKQPRVPRGWLKQVRNTKYQHNTNTAFPSVLMHRCQRKKSAPPAPPSHKPKHKQNKTKQTLTLAHTDYRARGPPFLNYQCANSGHWSHSASEQFDRTGRATPGHGSRQPSAARHSCVLAACRGSDEQKLVARARARAPARARARARVFCLFE